MAGEVGLGTGELTMAQTPPTCEWFAYRDPLEGETCDEEGRYFHNGKAYCWRHIGCVTNERDFKLAVNAERIRREGLGALWGAQRGGDRKRTA